MPGTRNRITPHLPGKRSIKQGDFRRPQFERRDGRRSVEFNVFVPGVEENGVDLALDAERLVVTAHKSAPMVTNWQPANISAAQRDYRLQLRLPRWVKKDRISADLNEGVLHIRLRKEQTGKADDVAVA